MINNFEVQSGMYKEVVRQFNQVANEFYYKYRDNDFNGEFENTLKFYLLRQFLYQT